MIEIHVASLLIGMVLMTLINCAIERVLYECKKMERNMERKESQKKQKKRPVGFQCKKEDDAED